jgi:hypothetical protein
MIRFALLLSLSMFSSFTFSQVKLKSKTFFKPEGIIKKLSDSALLDIVQRQTFRYFCHYARPLSGLARERSNSIRGEYFCDYAYEEYDEQNLSINVCGEEKCPIEGTGFGSQSKLDYTRRSDYPSPLLNTKILYASTKTLLIQFRR